MKNNNKTKKTSQVFVVSIMCTVLVSIVWQSLNVAINPNPQNSVQASREPQVHGVAWPESPSSLTNDMNTSVNKQKDQVNQWIKKMFGSGGGSKTQVKQLWGGDSHDWSSWFDYHPEDPHDHNNQTDGSNNQRDYVPFTMVQNNLKEKTCKYELPIDNADPPWVPIIQWALDHCLITVSSAYKVYPNDYLTHKMMRTIAERAWFTVKMEYATNEIVTNSQLLSFLGAIQKNHQISSLPAVPVGTKVTRVEYLTILYKLFRTDTAQDTDTLPPAPTTADKKNTSLWSQALSLGTNVLEWYTQDVSKDISNELKQQLLQYVSNTLSDDTSISTQEWSSDIAINMDAVTATLWEIQQWLGRS